jgi:hypothetical protein
VVSTHLLGPWPLIGSLRGVRFCRQDCGAARVARGWTSTKGRRATTTIPKAASPTSPGAARCSASSISGRALPVSYPSPRPSRSRLAGRCGLPGGRRVRAPLRPDSVVPPPTLEVPDLVHLEAEPLELAGHFRIPLAYDGQPEVGLVERPEPHFDSHRTSVAHLVVSLIAVAPMSNSEHPRTFACPSIEASPKCRSSRSRSRSCARGPGRWRRAVQR